MMEAINWVCTNVQENHEWGSEFSLALQENQMLGALKYDIDVPCSTVGAAWVGYSAPASLNNDLWYDGIIVERYSKVI